MKKDKDDDLLVAIQGKIGYRISVNNYRIQDGCHNCINVFVKKEYEKEDEYFCNIDKNRPKCGSFIMREEDDHDCNHQAEIIMKFKEWSQEREVCFSGMCDRYHKSWDDKGWKS